MTREPPDVFEDASAFMRLLGVHVLEASPQRIRAWLEVGPQHHQPFGLVHGGVYTAVIEQVASLGAVLTVRDRGLTAVGVSNSSDFLRPQREGRLDVVAEPLHQGRTQQLWQVVLTLGDGNVVARGQVRLQNIPLDQPSASR